MMSKALSIFLLLASVQCISGSNNVTTNVACPQEQDDGRVNLVYIHPDTGLPLKGWYSLNATAGKELEVLSFRGVSCACEHYACLCCAGLDVSWMPKMKGCLSTNYIPEDKSINFTLKFNKNRALSSIIPLQKTKRNSMFCARIPVGKDVVACVSVRDYKITENNLKACVNMIIEKSNTKLFVMGFKCYEVGPGKLPKSVPALADILNLPALNPTESNHHENPKSKDE